MAYAGGRTILDADNHVMELADFLDVCLGPADAVRLRCQVLDGLAPVIDDGVSKARERVADREVAGRAEERLLVDKGWASIGGFDGPERSRALDLLGFDAQPVFARFAPSLFALPRGRPATPRCRVRAARRPGAGLHVRRGGDRRWLRGDHGPVDSRRRAVADPYGARRLLVPA